MPYDLERVGTLISQHDTEKLIKRIHSFVKVRSNALYFPGWHAVTLMRRHIVDLINRDYFACEKSDGTRALLYVISERGKSYFFFIDRKLCCYRASENKSIFLDGDYLLDGEVVITDDDEIEYSVFDTIIFQNNSVMHLNLLERLRLADKFIRHQLCHLFNFKILVKKMYKAYGFAEAYESRFSLGHGNDGLIFTCVDEPYVFGTCNTLYKWKPPSLNTIDFQMRSEAEDVYSLWCMGRGGGMVMIGYFFDFEIDNDCSSAGKDDEENNRVAEKSDPVLPAKGGASDVVKDSDNTQEEEKHAEQINEDDEQHKRLKIDKPDSVEDHSGGGMQPGRYHKKIGEFHFNDKKKSICLDDYSIIEGKWELIKIREDKNTPNSLKVVSNIFLSMRENITYEDIVEHFEEIRRNWKIRESAKSRNERR